MYFDLVVHNFLCAYTTVGTGNKGTDDDIIPTLKELNLDQSLRDF